MKRFIRVMFWLVLVSLVGISAGAVVAQAAEEKKAPLYVPGQVIVKFKDTVTECVECVIQQQGQFKAATKDKSVSLDKLIAKHGVKRAKPVFRSSEFGVTKKGKKCTPIATIREKENKRSAVVQKKLSQRSQRKATIKNVSDLSHIYVLDLDKQQDIQTVIKDFAADGHVEFVQPNYLMEAYAFPETLPNDTYVDPGQIGQWSAGAWGQNTEDLWGLKKIHADAAWPITQGQRPNGAVIVAVVDTGLDYNHLDIADDIQSNVWNNADESLGDLNNDGCPGVCGVDDDGDGLIDEDSGGCGRNGSAGIGTVCSYLNDMAADDDENGFADDSQGWDFTTCQMFDEWGYCAVPKTPDNDPMDGAGHGTHVSGTIAAIGNNGRGIIGVAPQAKIMPLKALNDQGWGDTVELANAIVYAAKNGADVINNSWGCSGSCPLNLAAENAIQVAHELGAVVVFAAGNNAGDVRLQSPQNMVNFKPVVVAATNPNDEPACFSNYGNMVDVAAPGSGELTCPNFFSDEFRNILSLRAQGTGDPAMIVGGEYLRQAGTSMSAPHVSGVAALIRARHPEFSNDDVLQVLRSSAVDVAAPGVDKSTGFGRVDAARAVAVDTVPKLEITSPASYERIDFSAGPLVIRGTATAEQFKSYQIFYGKDRNPEQWIALTPIPVETPVFNNILGSLPIADLAGQYVIKLVLTTSDGKVFQIMSEFFVQVPNRSPAFAPSPWVYELTEGEIFAPAVSACDPDKDKMTGLMTSTPAKFTSEPYQICMYSCAPFPCVEMCDACTSFGTLAFQTGYEDAGTYQLDFWVDDGNGHRIAEQGQLIIHNENRWPSLAAAIPSPTVNEGELLTFDVTGQDPDLDDTITLRMEGVPVGATFEPIAAAPGSVTYRFNWRPGSDQVGTYDFSIRVEDDKGGAMGMFGKITVNNINHPPVIKPVAPQVVAVGQKLTITLEGSDPDGDTLTYSMSPLMIGMRMMMDGVFTWTPQASQVGNHTVNFTVRDGSLTASTAVSITVVAVNQPPVLTLIGNKSVTEGERLEFTVTATDPDGDPVTYRVNQLPIGAGFNGETGIFRWTPGYDQAGQVVVTFTALDQKGNLSLPQSVTITVANGNQAPMIMLWVSADQVKENEPVEVRVYGTDPDGDILTYSVGNMPSGAVFNAATHVFNWTPGNDQTGTYDIVFRVSDGALSASSTLTLTVLDSNRAPVLNPILSQTVTAGQVLSFVISGSDPDSDPLTYSTGGLPSGATFNPLTRQFSWPTSRNQSGIYFVTFQVSDGKLTAARGIQITVRNPKGR